MLIYSALSAKSYDDGLFVGKVVCTKEFKESFLTTFYSINTTPITMHFRAAFLPFLE